VIKTKHPLAKPVEVPVLKTDVEGRRLICPQHGFRLGKISHEKESEGVLASFVLKCPRCGYRERRMKAPNGASS